MNDATIALGIIALLCSAEWWFLRRDARMWTHCSRCGAPRGCCPHIEQL